MVLISMQLKKVEIYNNKMLSRLMNICCRFYYLALILSLLVAVHKDIQMCMKTYSCKQIYSKDIHALHTKILIHIWKDIHKDIETFMKRYSNAAFTATKKTGGKFWFLPLTKTFGIANTISVILSWLSSYSSFSCKIHPHMGNCLIGYYQDQTHGYDQGQEGGGIELKTIE